MAHGAEDSPRSLTSNNKRKHKSTVEDMGDRRRRQYVDAPQALPAMSKPSQSSESTRPIPSRRSSRHATIQQHIPTHEALPVYLSRTSQQAYRNASSELVPGNVDVPYPRLPRRRPSDAVKPNTTDLGVTSSSHSAEPRKNYDVSSRDYESELKVKTRRLEEQDSLIKTLRAEVSTLHRDLRSCQSQLDNVQRFISTADTHADVDIIQKLHELNEEVYNISMTMADRMAEGFTRLARKRISIGEAVLSSIGHVMMSHLTTLKVDDDIALFLQLAFQAYLSHALYHIVSSWTIDQNLNTAIEGTYQRLRSAETQTMSRRWRCLTRTHIQPTSVSNPDYLVKHTVAGLSEIVEATGLSSQRNTESRLFSEFGEDILSIVSHAGRLGGMISEMVSADFSIFVVQPGAAFDRESMAEDHPPPRGKREAQTVLCVSRVGLMKQTGERTVMLTKAQVMLQSFLGLASGTHSAL